MNKVKVDRRARNPHKHWACGLSKILFDSRLKAFAKFELMLVNMRSIDPKRKRSN